MIDKLVQLATVGLIAFVYFQINTTTKSYTTELRGYIFEIADQKIKYDSLYQVKDSVSNELFIQLTNATRYGIALDSLKNRDSVAARKFEECLSNIE